MPKGIFIMSHHMEARDYQLGLVDAWHHLTEVVKKIFKFKHEMERVPAQLRGKDVPGHSWIVSTLDGLPIGGPVADSFQYLPNSRWMERINEVLKLVKGSEIESLGTFDSLRKRYVAIRLNKGKDFKIGSRVFQPRLGIFGAVDRTMKDVMKGILTCPVCANTVEIGLGEASDLCVEMKHTKNHEEKWENADLAIDAFFNRSADFERLMETAEETAINEAQAHLALVGWLAEGKEASTRLLNTADRMKKLFVEGRGNAGKTGLDLISAVTDYYSHESSGGEDKWKQFTSSEIGSGNTMKTDFINRIKTDKFVFNRKVIADLSAMGKQTLALVKA
jgi:hypothetical protein